MNRIHVKNKASRRLACLFGLAGVLATLAAVAGDSTNSPAPFAPTSHYHEIKIEGWRILVNTNLSAEKNLHDRTIKLLTAQLHQITKVVPAGPLAKLREIPIWVEHSSKQFACMCYHESREWLSTHGVNPEKTGAVELANPTNFLTWTRDQPWMVLHELAHGYHQRFLGSDHAGILESYKKAKASKTYDSILRNNGRKERHYALNNHKEYFAEATEAFFGTNDFYPFTRTELKEHDPTIYEVLKRVWEVDSSKL